MNTITKSSHGREYWAEGIALCRRLRLRMEPHRGEEAYAPFFAALERLQAEYGQREARHEHAAD